MANHATAMEAYCDSSIISPLCLAQTQLHNTRSFLLNGDFNYKPEISKGTGREQQMEMEALSHPHCYLQCCNSSEPEKCLHENRVWTEK